VGNVRFFKQKSIFCRVGKSFLIKKTSLPPPISEKKNKGPPPPPPLNLRIYGNYLIEIN